MSNDLVQRQAPAIQSMDDLARVSDMFAKSGMFRDSRDAAQAGVKILAGLESGFGAFASMTGMHVIEGKATIGANLMALAIKRSGKYNYKVLEHTEKACMVEIYERWDGKWQSVGKSGFTLEDAKKAGVRFQDSKGGPTPWAKFPRNMMFARAISNAVRWYCPDALSATVYVPEELGANVDGEGEIIQAVIVEPEPPPKPPQKPARTESASPPAKGSNLQAEPAKTGKTISSEAANKLWADLEALGYDERRAYIICDFVTEREVSKLTELTEREADEVLTEAKFQKENEDAPPFEPDPPAEFDPHAKPKKGTLSNEKASDLHRALGKFGCKDHPKLALDVLGREVESFTDLTQAEAVKVYEGALERFGTQQQIDAYFARKAS